MRTRKMAGCAGCYPGGPLAIPSKRQVKGFAWEPVINILTHYLRYEVWAHLVLAARREARLRGSRFH